jgi:hypothetical protein
MVALEDLDEGETVFKIPRNVLLEPNTSSICETVSEFAKNLPEIHTRYFTCADALRREFVEFRMR